MTQMIAGLSPEFIQRRQAEAEAALKRLQANPRVKYIMISVPKDACESCRELAGAYPKDQVPSLPMEDCSHPLGCRSFYQPFLTDIYP